MDTLTRPKPPSEPTRTTRTVRFSEAELRIIKTAAATVPTYLTRYIREAALDAAKRDIAGCEALADTHDPNGLEHVSHIVRRVLAEVSSR